MTSQFTHGYALLIAVDQSAEARWELPFVAKDISALQAVLVHPERCAYPPDNVKVVQGEVATRAGILDGLAWLRQKLAEDKSENETAIVYFTGHGLRDITGKEPIFYLRPYDAQQDDLPGTALRAEDFASEIQDLAPRRLLVLLDCCHAGGMEAKGEETATGGWQSIAMPPSLFMSSAKDVLPGEGSKGLEGLGQGSGRAVLSSSRADQSSWLRRDRSMSMSIFTYHLVEALTGHAQPKEGASEVLVSDVMSYVSRKVPESAEADWNKPQEPDFQVSGNFAVALLLGGEGLSKGAPPDPLAPLPAAPASAVTIGAESVVVQNKGGNTNVNIGLPPWALLATLGAVMLIALMIWFVASSRSPEINLAEVTTPASGYTLLPTSGSIPPLDAVNIYINPQSGLPLAPTAVSVSSALTIIPIPSATSTATMTPTPALSPTPSATSTPIVTSTATLTLTPAPTSTPLPGATWTNPIDGALYVYVPYGSESFWVKQTEVTNADYLRCVEAGSCYGTRLVEELIDPSFKNHPVRGLYLHQARQYAKWAGGRLPTDQEWTRACQGPVDRLYPWGFATPDSTRANYEGHVGDTTPVGSYPNGVSPYGVLDLSGNVWEFTDTPWLAGDNDTFIMRGGSWRSGGDSLACTDDHRSPYLPELSGLRMKIRDGTRTDDLGFRVVVVR